MPSEPKVIEVEVVREPADSEPSGSARASSGPPIHPLSALLLIVVDNLWMLEEWAVITWIITIPLAFLSVFGATFVIQKLVKKDSFGRAFGLAFLLGVVAAVPTSITGTPVGLALLAWTGLSKLFPSSFPRAAK